jgi:hypothetical protein
MWNHFCSWDKHELELFLDYLQTSEWQRKHPYRTYFNIRWCKPVDEARVPPGLGKRFYNASEPIVARPNRRAPVAFDSIPMAPVNLTYWNDAFDDATFHNLTVMNNLRTLPPDEYANIVAQMPDVTHVDT